MSPSTSPSARKARNSTLVLSSLLTTVQRLATSREAGRRVEGWLPDSILEESINVVLWMREKEQALQFHRQRFGEDGRAFAAPARMNVIGEHTDYTGGLVMPMAIGFRTVAVLSPRIDNRAVFYSASFDEEVSFEIASGLTPEGRWSDYPAGVLWSLRQEGLILAASSLRGPQQRRCGDPKRGFQPGSPYRRKTRSRFGVDFQGQERVRARYLSG
jgi:hypothetical protein